MAEMVRFSPRNDEMGDQELRGSLVNTCDDRGGDREPRFAITGTYSSAPISKGAERGEMDEESGLLPLLMPSLSPAPLSLFEPNELRGERFSLGYSGGERRSDGNGSLPIEGRALDRPELLPVDELDSLGSFNDSLASDPIPLGRGEGASLLGLTKNRAASAICCSDMFQH